MENAILIQADGRIKPVCIETWTEDTLAAVLGVGQVKRCWSHSLISFGADCGVALMGYTDADPGRNLPANIAAAKLMGTPVYGAVLLVYWDSHNMCCGGLEPQEVERAVKELQKRK